MTRAADILSAAMAALEVAYHPAKTSTDQIIEAVCSAIEAERERCATIADEHAFDEHALAQATDHGKGADIAARDIAAAIRKGAA